MEPVASFNLSGWQDAQDAQPKAYEGDVARPVLSPGCFCTLRSLKKGILNGCRVVVAEKTNPGAPPWSDDRIEVILNTDADGYPRGTHLLVKPQNIERVAAYDEMIANFPKMFERSV